MEAVWITWATASIFNIVILPFRVERCMLPSFYSNDLRVNIILHMFIKVLCNIDHKSLKWCLIQDSNYWHLQFYLSLLPWLGQVK